MSVVKTTTQGSPNQYEQYTALDGSDPPPGRHVAVEGLHKIRMIVDEAGFGHTFIDDIEISPLVYGVELHSFVGESTKIELWMRGFPIEIEAMGTVVIHDDQLLKEVIRGNDTTTGLRENSES